MPPRKQPERSKSFSLPNDFHGDATRAAFPRQLVFYEEKSNTWSSTTDEDILANIEYLAVSYRQTDFPNKEEFEKDIRIICQIHNLQAYWLDYACTGATPEEKNRDLYRIADVFRGAKVTLIMVRGNDDRPLSEGWMSWGDRIWTLPEALLSDVLIFKVGTRFIKNINLRRLANVAYRDREEEMMLIDGYSGKDPLPLHERVELLRRAIWKRSSGPDKKVSVQGARTNIGGIFTGYPAERVYALMGFMQYRIMPNRHQTEDEAFAQLMAANKLEGHKFSWDIEAPRAVSPEPQDSEVDNLGRNMSDTHLSPDSHAGSSGTRNEKGQFVPDASSEPVNDLDADIAKWETAVRVLPDVNPNKVNYYCKLGISLRMRFDKTSNKEDMDKAIEAEKNAVRLTPDGHKDKPCYLNNLAILYDYRYEFFNDLEDLNRAIDLRNAAIRFVKDNDPSKAEYHDMLSKELWTRSKKTGNATDIDDAIASEREAVKLTTKDKRLKARYSYRLGVSLETRYKNGGEIDDLHEAIERQRDAISLVTDDIDKAFYLASLGMFLQSLYEASKNMSDIDEAVESGREAVCIAPLPAYHSKLAYILQARYKVTNSKDDLEENIANGEAAVRLAPDNDTAKVRYLRNVAMSYENRYNKLRNIDDLRKSIEHSLASVELMDDSDTIKAVQFRRLGISFGKFFDVDKDVDKLDMAIKYEEEAVRLTPDSFPEKVQYHINVGISYQSHFNEFGDLPSIDKAIIHGKEILRLTKDTDVSDKDRTRYLYNLVQLLLCRHEKRKNRNDIDTAIDSLRELIAMKIMEDDDNIGAMELCLSKLAESLESRFELLGNADDLLEAEALKKEWEA